jgi:hypothetical protein
LERHGRFGGADTSLLRKYLLPQEIRLANHLQVRDCSGSASGSNPNSCSSWGWFSATDRMLGLSISIISLPQRIPLIEILGAEAPCGVGGDFCVVWIMV